MKLKFNSDKRYPLTDMGIVKAMSDMRQAKLNKISGYTGVAVIVGMFAIGILGKELFTVLLINKGVGKIATMLMK